MSKFVPLHLHSTYSLLDGLSKPADIASRCKELGYDTCALTDHAVISGAVAFASALTKAKIKPILGCEFYVPEQHSSIQSKENPNKAHLCVLAKNEAGWKKLISAVSEANRPENFYYKPRLSRLQFAPFAGDLIAFSGHIGSELANVLFTDYKAAYNSRTFADAADYLKSNWFVEAKALLESYLEVFGEKNFFIEIQIIDQEHIPSTGLIGECLRELSIKTGVPKIATADSHYCRKEDAPDQRVLLCSAFQTTLGKVYSKLSNNEDVTLGGFFRSNNYHIPSYEEMAAIHTDDEIENTLLIGKECDSYKILSKPRIAKFTTPNNETNDEYLQKLCDEGMKKISFVNNTIPLQEYKDRLKHEMEVIVKNGLSGYFLIVQDYIAWAKAQGMLVGPGRGSGAGCLVSYLVGITSIDPLKYGLIFERFYNEGRNSGDHIELPDIDSDFPKGGRDRVVEYVKQKYGEDKVSHIVTFHSMKGKNALTEVLHAHEACTFEEVKRITSNIPEEAKITDQLQVMKEARGEASIIQWALENDAESLKEWCYIDENDELAGPFARYFAQAIRIEGTKKAQSKHASGIVISAEPLANETPIFYDKKTGEAIAGMEMNDLAAMGHVKFDILALKNLNVLMGVREGLRGTDCRITCLV